MDWLEYLLASLGIIVAALSIYKFFRKSPAEKLVVNDESTESNVAIGVADRFVNLFENHGVHRNEIPRFFGHDLTLSKLKSNETLLEHLTDPMLSDACKMFAVRREWLDGVEERIYPLHDFYKSPEKFIEFIEHLTLNNEHWVDGVLLVADSDKFEMDALIVLEETVGFIGNKVIYRYHICNNWMFKYWKSRAYMVACIASAWQRRVHIMGREVSIDVIRNLDEGKKFLEYVNDSALPTKGRHWHPEDMVVEPEQYLSGLDPERDNFGLKSGLEMWLHLEEEGFMDINLPYENVKENFQKALKNINTN